MKTLHPFLIIQKSLFAEKQFIFQVPDGAPEGSASAPATTAEDLRKATRKVEDAYNSAEELVKKFLEDAKKQQQPTTIIDAYKEISRKLESGFDQIKNSALGDVKTLEDTAEKLFTGIKKEVEATAAKNKTIETTSVAQTDASKEVAVDLSKKPTLQRVAEIIEEDPKLVKQAFKFYRSGRYRDGEMTDNVSRIVKKITEQKKAGKLDFLNGFRGDTDGHDHKEINRLEYHKRKADALKTLLDFYKQSKRNPNILKIEKKGKEVKLSWGQRRLINKYIKSVEEGKGYEFVHKHGEEFLTGGEILDLALSVQRAQNFMRGIEGDESIELNTEKHTLKLVLGGDVDRKNRKAGFDFSELEEGTEIPPAKEEQAEATVLEEPEILTKEPVQGEMRVEEGILQKEAPETYTPGTVKVGLPESEEEGLKVESLDIEPKVTEPSPAEPEVAPAEAEVAPAEPKAAPSPEASPAEPKASPAPEASPAEPKASPAPEASPAEPEVAPAEPKAAPAPEASPAEPAAEPEPAPEASPAEPEVAPAEPKASPAPEASPAEPEVSPEASPAEPAAEPEPAPAEPEEAPSPAEEAPAPETEKKPDISYEIDEDKKLKVVTKSGENAFPFELPKGINDNDFGVSIEEIDGEKFIAITLKTPKGTLKGYFGFNGDLEIETVEFEKMENRLWDEHTIEITDEDVIKISKSTEAEPTKPSEALENTEQ